MSSCGKEQPRPRLHRAAPPPRRSRPASHRNPSQALSRLVRQMQQHNHSRCGSLQSLCKMASLHPLPTRRSSSSSRRRRTSNARHRHHSLQPHLLLRPNSSNLRIRPTMAYRTRTWPRSLPNKVPWAQVHSRTMLGHPIPNLPSIRPQDLRILTRLCSLTQMDSTLALMPCHILCISHTIRRRAASSLPVRTCHHNSTGRTPIRTHHPISNMASLLRRLDSCFHRSRFLRKIPPGYTLRILHHIRLIHRHQLPTDISPSRQGPTFTRQQAIKWAFPPCILPLCRRDSRSPPL